MCWWILRSQIRYSSKIAKASRGSGTDGAVHNNLGRECQLERWQRLLERQCQFGWEPERLERRQSGALSLLLSFFRFYNGSFCFNAFSPSAKPKNTSDPTGAGDAYRAGLIKGLIENYSLEKAGRLAGLVAVYAVEKYGTQTHKFNWSQLKARYRQNFKDSL